MKIWLKTIVAAGLLALAACSDKEPPVVQTPEQAAAAKQARLERGLKIAIVGFNLYLQESELFRQSGIDVNVLDEEQQRYVRLACGSGYLVYAALAALQEVSPDAEIKDEAAAKALEICLRIADDLGSAAPLEAPLPPQPSA